MEIVEVQITCSDNESAQNIAEYLIKKQLVACVNISSTFSLYSWKNELNKEEEYLVLLKTMPHCIEELIREIKRIHPYELPAILYWKMTATEEFGSWVKEQVTRFEPN